VQASENRARIALTAQVNPNTPRGRRMVRFTLRLNNTGEEALRNVNLSEQFPAGQSARCGWCRRARR
jgi:hypothetical protein